MLVLGLVCKFILQTNRWESSLNTYGTTCFREYDFFNFNTFQGNNGSIDVILYLSPSLNANTDAQPLAYSIHIDSQVPTSVVPVGPEVVPGGLPDGWDGWVANSIITVSTIFEGISRGNHTLKVSWCPSSLRNPLSNRLFFS